MNSRLSAIEKRLAEVARQLGPDSLYQQGVQKAIEYERLHGREAAIEKAKEMLRELVKRRGLDPEIAQRVMG